MSKVEISVRLQEELVEDANKFDLLTDEHLAQILQAEIERRKALDEEIWEAEILDEAFGDALSDDGQVDFDKLRANGIVISSEEVDKLSKQDA